MHIITIKLKIIVMNIIIIMMIIYIHQLPASRRSYC